MDCIQIFGGVVQEEQADQHRAVACREVHYSLIRGVVVSRGVSRLGRSVAKAWCNESILCSSDEVFPGFVAVHNANFSYIVAIARTN